MDGTLGVVVNGAGLALATLDMIVEAGGRPSNFMDIRTTASSIDVAYGFELILANPNVGVVLLNVHGGGMQRCDTIAEGVGIAIRRTGRSLPLVVRLAGNNAEFARTRLQSYGIRFEEGADMHDAVARAVALSRGGRQAA
jgi:succinyl-CoA synthetase beta subunit